MTLMKPKKGDIPISKDYIYELKYDGGSSVITISKGKVTIQHGDNPDDQTYKYPELSAELTNCSDGAYIAELVVIDKDHIGGHFPGFLRRQCQNHFKIQDRMHTYPITAQIHDIIDDKPLLERKRLINERIKESDHVKIVRYYDTPDPINALEGKIEGIIAKRKDSHYKMDSRDGWWKKRFNKRENVLFTTYEEWEKETGEKGLVLITPDKRRATLAGSRVDEAKERIDRDGKVVVLLEYHEKTEDGFRFPVVKRVGEDGS